jgi:3-hydroxyacyl-CoA dehydrogenase
LVPEITHDIVSVDAALRHGYNWKYGPFELIDQVGTAWFARRLGEMGLPVPPLLKTAAGRPFYRTEAGRLQHLTADGAYRDVVRPAGVLLLGDIKRRTRPVARNHSASLWDIGDGVLCLEFHSKMNSLNPLTLNMVEKAIALVPGQYKGLVIYNEGDNFSVGANIGLLLIAMKLRASPVVRYLARRGQDVYRKLKYAPFPVVGAPAGLALGGGCEILLHCDAVQAHAETYAGLVETGVGIVPAWGGCKEMLLRWTASKARSGGPMPPVMKTFETIGMATVAKSAEQAKDLLFLRPGDGITMNRDRLLADAKAKALSLAENYVPPSPPRISLPGKSALAALSLAVDGYRRMGKATPHDVVVGKRLATVVSGGNTDMTESLGEDDMLALEREAIVDLARHPASVARVAYTLKTGKPLRN